MCERIDDIVGALRDAVATLAARSLPNGANAVRLVDAVSEGERLMSAARTIAVGWVAQTRAHHGLGYRTAAQFLASRTRGKLGDAITSVETAARLHEAPATREAFVAGRISDVQAAEITAAVSADPSAESSLLDLASRESVVALREQCREVRAAAVSDENVCERIRLGRFLRHWSDDDGAVRINARFAPDDGARLIATIDARAASLQEDARRSGSRERAEAYAADALVGLAAGEAGPRGVVNVVVDEASFQRGHVEPGETCRIDGIGPLPVSAARRLASGSDVRVVGRDGADVTRVTKLGRTIPARVRAALEVRDPTCVVPGCDATINLEIDHIVPFAEGGPTRLDNLARLCRHHHSQKTHHGAALRGVPGAWIWEYRGRTSTGKGPPRPRPP